jgi:hypothetical protein
MFHKADAIKLKYDPTLKIGTIIAGNAPTNTATAAAAGNKDAQQKIEKTKPARKAPVQRVIKDGFGELIPYGDPAWSAHRYISIINILDI